MHEALRDEPDVSRQRLADRDAEIDCIRKVLTLLALVLSSMLLVSNKITVLYWLNFRVSVLSIVVFPSQFPFSLLLIVFFLPSVDFNLFEINFDVGVSDDLGHARRLR